MDPGRRVFISYSRRDGRELALRLREGLTAQGVTAWLDTAGIDGGDSWSSVIEQELDAADVVLALMSVGSFASDICRGEQLRALRRGKCVVPVLVSDDADRPVYLEAAHYIDFSGLDDYDTSLTRLVSAVQQRKGAGLVQQYRKTQYETVPPLPDNYVAPVNDLRVVRDALLQWGEGHARLLYLHGMPGSGKTVLAQAICRRDDVIQAAYPDGICWVTLGRTPGDLTLKIRAVARALGESVANFDSFDEAKARLRAILTNKAALIVLDDVWDVRHVEPFRSEASRCRVLCTTRDASLMAGIGGRECTVALPDGETSRTLLAAYAGVAVSDLPADADLVIRGCGRLPLALAICGALVRRHRGDWSSLLQRLQLRRLSRASQTFPEYAYSDLFSALDVSVEAMSPTSRARYDDMAVFAEDARIPAACVSTLWDCPPFEALDTIAELRAASLVLDAGRGNVALHDVHRDFLHERVGEDAVVALHRKLVDNYRRTCGRWIDGPADGYYFEHLASHLASAGRLDELRALLVDCEWMRVKLMNASLQSLSADYDFVKDDPPLALLQGAIQLSASGVARDVAQLPGQVYGRLIPPADADIARFTESIVTKTIAPWIRPVSPSLAPAGGPLLLSTNTGSAVNAVAVVPGGERLLSGHKDGSVRVWDGRTLQCVKVLETHRRPVHAIALAGAAMIATIQFNDGRLSVWDLRTLEHLREMTGGLRALATTPHGDALVTDAGWGTAMLLGGDGRTERVVGDHDGFVHAADFTPDGQTVVTAADDKTIRIYERASGRRVALLTDHADWVTAVAVAPDGARLASGSRDGIVRIWRLPAAQLDAVIETAGGSIRALMFTPDSRRVALASSSGRLFLWDVIRRKKVMEVAAHVGHVQALAIAPSGDRAVTGGADAALKVWTFAAPRDDVRVARPKARAVAFSSDDRVVISCSGRGACTVWDPATGYGGLPVETDATETPADAEEDGDDLLAEFVVASSDQSVYVATHRELRQFTPGEVGSAVRRIKLPAPVTAIAPSPKAGRVLAISIERMFIVDVERGEVVIPPWLSLPAEAWSAKDTGEYIEVSSDRVSSIVTIRDASVVVTRTYAGNVAALTVESGEVVKALVIGPGSASGESPIRIHKNPEMVWEISATADREHVITHHWSGMNRIWNTSDWSVVAEVQSLPLDNCKVIVRPDGIVWHVVVEERTVCWYATLDGTPLGSFTVDDTISSWCLSRDGATAVVGDSSGIMHFLRLTPAAQVAIG